MLALSTGLNDVDPLYRYEMDIRAGHLRDEPFTPVTQAETNVAFVHYLQFTDDCFRVMRIIPRHPAALLLRPISATIRLSVESGSPDHEAIENFRHFGAPFTDIPGTVSAVSGPPGIHSSSDDGLFTVMALPSNAEHLPDLELRLLSADGQVADTLDLVDVEISCGIDTPGIWISGKDRAGAITFTMLLNGPDGDDEIVVEPQSATGKSPREVLPAVRFKAAMTNGSHLLLAVRGGPIVTDAWPIEGIDQGPGPHNVTNLMEALIEVQRHTLARVVIPDLNATDPAELAAIIRTARLLRGEHLNVTWTEVTMTVGTPEHLPPADAAEAALLLVEPMTITVNGQIIPLNAQRRVFYASAKLADTSDAQNVRPGDEIRITPAGNNTAVLAAITAA